MPDTDTTSDPAPAATAAPRITPLVAALAGPAHTAVRQLRRAAVPLAVLVAVLVALGGTALWLSHQRMALPAGEQLVRTNTLTDTTVVLQDGPAWVLPGLHRARLRLRELLAEYLTSEGGQA